MIKTLQIALNDMRITLRDNSVWINLVIIPAVLIFLIGFVNGGFGSNEPEDVTVDVIDNDQSDVSGQFLEALRVVNASLVLCPMDNDADDRCGLEDADLDMALAAERVDDGDTAGLILIPEGFADRVQAGEPVQIEFRTDLDPTEPSFLIQSVQAAAQQVGGASAAAQAASIIYTSAGATFDDEADQMAFEESVYTLASQMWQSPPAEVTYSDTAESASSQSGFAQSVPGMGSMYVMFTVLAGAVILIQERQNWTLQRLITMPVSRAQLLGGKILARIGMGMIQYGVAFAVGLALGVDFGGSPLGLLLLMISFTVCISALAFLLATLVSTEQQANGVITFMALTLAPLGGAWWPLEIVPKFMQVIGHISPVAWVMDGFSELIFYSGTLADVVAPVAVLLVIAAVFFGAGIMRFRYE